MPAYAWVLIFLYAGEGNWSVIDNIASAQACEELKAKVPAVQAKCIRYEIATPRVVPAPN